VKLTSTHFALIVALIVVSAYAISRRLPSEPVESQPVAAHDAVSLPPSHPPMPSGKGLPTMNDAPTLAWKVPAEWTTMPNASSMRLATYHVPAAKGDADETEVSVVRAGGSAAANIDRWIKQFDEAGKDERTEKTVGSFKITIVEVSGRYLGGAMMPSADSEPRKGWSLLGAVVETSSSPYFFKMTGPTASVKAARATFVALLDGVTAP
jgi:hypothetical protein